MSKKPNPAQILAAAYVRMSGRQQDKSPAEQRAEIVKLAARENCRIVEWFSDEAITGDSTADERPGLAALLAGAKAGKFTVVLAWHTNRISREEPMDAIVFYNQLRKAKVALHTCCEGAIDLEDFAKQLLLFVNQKASNDYLTELAAKSLRGRIATAKMGDWAAGPAPYGMDRGEFDRHGRLIRRLAPGDKRSIGNRLRLLPCADPQKLEAIRYAFHRADTAHVSDRQLARELQARGYPSPGLNGWTRMHVQRLLTNCAYAGVNRWGRRASGKYYQAHGDEVIPSNAPKAKCKWTCRADEETITVNGALEAIIPLDLFERVCRKALPIGRTERRTANNAYPLSGLLVCAHCGRNMVASTATVRNAKGGILYQYQRYVCGSFVRYGRDGLNNKTCGHHSINAARALEWLVYKLQAIYFDTGHNALVETIRAKLKARKQPTSGDVERLQKRIQELDRQVNRLVAAIRVTDATELTEELATVREEREAARNALASAKKPAAGKGLETEPERIAGRLKKLLPQLGRFDPAILREVLRRLVAKIECRWGHRPGKHTLYPLLEARIELCDATAAETSPGRAIDCPADIAGGLVTFHAGSAADRGDCAEALADLLISSWEAGKAPRRKRQ
jgi:site-specific DNA recombinase